MTLNCDQARQNWIVEYQAKSGFPRNILRGRSGITSAARTGKPEG